MLSKIAKGYIERAVKSSSSEELTADLAILNETVEEVVEIVDLVKSELDQRSEPTPAPVPE